MYVSLGSLVVSCMTTPGRIAMTPPTAWWCMGTLMNKPINFRPPVSTALPLCCRLGGPTLTPFTGATPQTGRWQTLPDRHSFSVSQEGSGGYNSASSPSSLSSSGSLFLSLALFSSTSLPQPPRVLPISRPACFPAGRRLLSNQTEECL